MSKESKRVLIGILLLAAFALGYLFGRQSVSEQLRQCEKERDRSVKRGIIAQGLLGICVGDPKAANDQIEEMLRTNKQ